MRIIHTSDWHLGRQFFGFDLSESFARWGDFLVDLAQESAADAVLIAGDLYDRSVPAEQTIALFADILQRLLSVTQVVITSGNHDSAQRLGFAADFFRKGLYIQTDSRRSGQPIVLQNKAQDVGAIVYAIPYLDPDRERTRLAPSTTPLPRSHAAVMQQATHLIQADLLHGKYADLQVPRIAMAHAFVSGSQKSDSEIDLQMGGVDAVPASAFQLQAKRGVGLNYVALGHLHRPQEVAAGENAPLLRYCGSPIPFSFSEAKWQKSTAVVDFTELHTPQVELIPHDFSRPLVTVRGTLSQLLHAADFAAAESAFTWIELTDLERPRDAIALLRQRFPYLVHVTQENLPQLQPLADAKSLENEPLKVIETFFAQASGQALSDPEKALLREIWESSDGAGDDK